MRDWVARAAAIALGTAAQCGLADDARITWDEITKELSEYKVESCAFASTQSVQERGHRLVVVDKRRFRRDEADPGRYGMQCGSIEESSAHLYLQEGERYRLLKAWRSIDGVYSVLVSRNAVSGQPARPDALLLEVLLQYPGTGNHFERELYRLDEKGELDPVPIASPAQILAAHLGPKQSLNQVGYGFGKDPITFGTNILNPGDSNRFPSGGSAFGAMRLIPAERGLALVPDPASLQLPSKSSHFNRLGLKAYHAKRYDNAIAHFKEAIRWHRTNYEAIANLGLAYLRSGQTEDGIRVSRELAEEGKAHNKHRAAAAFNLGQAYEAQNNRPAATKYYRMAYELDANQDRGMALYRLGGTPSNWGGSKNPLAIDRVEGFERFSFKSLLGDASVTDAVADGEGLWIASKAGVVRFREKDKRFESVFRSSPEKGWFVAAIEPTPTTVYVRAAETIHRVAVKSQGIGVLEKDGRLRVLRETSVNCLRQVGRVLWYCGDKFIGRFNPDTGEDRRFPTGDRHPGSIAAVNGDVWASDAGRYVQNKGFERKGALLHLDPDRGAVRAYDHADGLLASGLSQIAADGDTIWAMPWGHMGFGVAGFDPKSGRFRPPVRDNDGAWVSGNALAVDDRYVWVGGLNRLTQIDKRTGRSVVFGCLPRGESCPIGEVWRVALTKDYVYMVMSRWELARISRPKAP